MAKLEWSFFDGTRTYDISIGVDSSDEALHAKISDAVENLVRAIEVESACSSNVCAARSHTVNAARQIRDYGEQMESGSLLDVDGNSINSCIARSRRYIGNALCAARNCCDDEQPCPAAHTLSKA
ncbi:MAG: hypothetical protein HQL39_15155, partial [Alphaproteobacteria bacterium]|nr:hypothetical protein [Alphaproteobacteria bacterium]